MSSHTALWATFAQTATALKLRTSFIANRDGHPRARGVPGQQSSGSRWCVPWRAGRSPSFPPGDCLVSLTSWSSTPPRGSGSTRAIPHACFSPTYTTFITLQPSVSVSLAWHRLAGSQVVGVAQTYGVIGSGDWGSFCEKIKQHRCWLLCHGSEQRSQAVKQPGDLGVTSQKNQYLDELGSSQMSKIPHW